MRSEHIVRHRLTVSDYYRMAEVGILKPDARVELIEGEIIDMAPMGSRHAYVVAELTRRMIAAVGFHAEVRCQLPMRLDDYSEPEPDIAVVKARGQHYASVHPSREDVLLLIEVSDSSIAFDRSVKLPLYARHDIPEVWTADLSANQMYAHSDPRDGFYQKTKALKISTPQPVLLLPDMTIDLSFFAA